MSAIFHWCESNEAGEVETQDIANLNFGNQDAPEVDVDLYPVTRGQNSYSKYIRALFTGTWTDITAIKFWKSLGDYVSGETLKAAANVAYVTPSKTSTGDSNIPTIEGSALSINSAEGEVNIEYGGSGVSGYTSYIRLQLQSLISTPPGAVNQKTFTLQYDEV
jgi:hypothetical protein